MSNKSPFCSASHFANNGSWKAGSPTSNPLLLKAQSRQLFIGLQQSDSTTESTMTVFMYNLGDHNCLTKRFASLRETGSFFRKCNEGMGKERTVALRNLLLVETGWFEFQNGTAGMDVLNKHVEQISFRQCHVLRTSELKGWQPHFPPTVAKSSILTQCNSMANGKNMEKYSLTNLGDHNSVTKPMLLYMRHKSGIFDKGMGSFARLIQA